MKLKKSKDIIDIAEVLPKEKKSFLSIFSKKKGELSHQELKEQKLAAANKPKAKEQVKKVVKVVGKVLLTLFLVAVIFSMVAMPLLIVFN